jgi:hypothetical protein
MDVDLHMSVFAHLYNSVLYIHNQCASVHNSTDLCYTMVTHTSQTCDMFPSVFCLHIVLHKNKNDSEVKFHNQWVPGYFPVGKATEV